MQQCSGSAGVLDKDANFLCQTEGGRESNKASSNFEQGTSSLIRRSEGVTQSQIVASGSFSEQHNNQAGKSH